MPIAIPRPIASAAFGVQEFLLRRSTLACARALNQSQWWSPIDLRQLQQRKLHSLLRHARENVAFYRSAVPAIAHSRFEDSTRLLAGLPTVTRGTFRESPSNFRCTPVSAYGVERRTSGSTGDPMPFVLDFTRQAMDQAARIRAERWFGVRLGSPQIWVWGAPQEAKRQGFANRARGLRNRLVNHLLLSAFRTTESELDMHLDAWDRFRPVSVTAYPSSLAHLVVHARSRGRRLDVSRLRAIFVTAEYCLPSDRAMIADYFQRPVADGYGSREAGFIAHECPAGNHHITAESVIVEILDGDRPLPAGELGEIVVTHLDNFGMPFIRYRTDDIGRLKPGRCRCGRGLPMMDVVLGRRTDLLHLPNGERKHPQALIYHLRETPGIKQFRIVQGEDLAVTMELVPEAIADPAMPSKLADRFQRILGADIPFRVEIVDRIEPSPSGKLRCVISKAGENPTLPGEFRSSITSKAPPVAALEAVEVPA